MDEISEYKTRKIYIDLELKIAGWEFGKDVLECQIIKESDLSITSYLVIMVNYLRLLKQNEHIDCRTIQRPLTEIEIKDEISNHYYQKEAKVTKNNASSTRQGCRC